MKGMIERAGIVAAVGLAVVAIASVPALSQGSRPTQLQELKDAGWACPVLLGAVHCLPPGTFLRDGKSPALTALVFAGTDPDAADAPFLGTEHLLRADVFERGGQRPCPQDPPTFVYRDLRTTELGIPYYACHTYDSSF
jgi:hypothetical protein